MAGKAPVEGVFIWKNPEQPTVGVTKVETRKVTFAEAANRTFIVKVNGTEVKSGAQITKGDKITVETSPNANYTASVSINGTIRFNPCSRS